MAFCSSARVSQVIAEISAGKRCSTSVLSPIQRPTFFGLPDLAATPFHNPSDPWCQSLESNWEIIRGEFASARETTEKLSSIVAAVREGGRWNVFYLIKEGERVEKNLAQCPITASILSEIPLLEGCSLGYCYFSVLLPGTHILPHFGVSNVKLRLHLGLNIPSRDSEICAIKVGGETRTWEEGKVMLFDDSFQHEAYNRSDKERIVLLCDIWHPEVTKEEIASFNSWLSPTKHQI